MLEHLAELRGEEAIVSEFPKEDLAKYLSPADLHVLEDPRESPSRLTGSKLFEYLPCYLHPFYCYTKPSNQMPIMYLKRGKEVSYLE